MEQSIEGQQLMAEGPKASAEAAGMAGGQSAAQPAMGQRPQGGCDCEETASNPQPQMAQPAGQAEGMGQPMAASGQQAVGMNPQMAAQPAAQAVGMGQQQAMYDPYQYAAWQAWYQQQAAQTNAATIASQAAGPGSATTDGRSHHPKYDAHKYGQMIDTVGRFLNGEANVGEVVNGLFSLNFQDDQFWKGAVVGAVAALLLTNETVQSGLTKTVGTIFATAQSGVEKVTKTYKEATEEVKKEKEKK
ncbi:MAG: hypothetical protein LWX01_05335 [Deltaproteobacteria bacterium]|nr:hypothetical protein [Deltaproteobacteria bacterium]MDL1961111.1 hypothetical protein [Deltaproteobacteria bacterium]